MDGPSGSAPPPRPVDDPVLAHATFHVTPADLAACLRTQLRWRYRRPQILYWPLLATVVADIFVLYGSNEVTVWTLLEPGCFIFGWFAAMLALNYALVPWTARRSYARQPSLRGAWRVEFTRFGLRAVTTTQDNLVAWSDYVAWSRNEKVWVVYHANNVVQFMPARAFLPETAAVAESLVKHLPRR